MVPSPRRARVTWAALIARSRDPKGSTRRDEDLSGRTETVDPVTVLDVGRRPSNRCTLPAQAGAASATAQRPHRCSRRGLPCGSDAAVEYLLPDQCKPNNPDQFGHSVPIDA